MMNPLASEKKTFNKKHGDCSVVVLHVCHAKARRRTVNVISEFSGINTDVYLLVL